MKTLELSSAMTAGKSFTARVEANSKVNVRSCYQCGKCSAGCPAAYAMDYAPHLVIRMVQLGLEDRVLSSHAIWLCASCETCLTRCPREVDLPALMDTLRKEAQKKEKIAEKDVNLFNKLFLESVEANGRSHEMSMMMKYNMKSGHLMKDVFHGPSMMLQGKMTILPENIKDDGAVKRIFAKVREVSGGEVS
ncbi:MAG: 4Fe-4S dicluster domain-containing protein [Lawsonibacter sp.]|jgi:heterodisulfide reductase subunit C